MTNPVFCQAAVSGVRQPCCQIGTENGRLFANAHIPDIENECAGSGMANPSFCARTQTFDQSLTGTLHFGNFDKNFRFYTYVGITKR